MAHNENIFSISFKQVLKRLQVGQIQKAIYVLVSKKALERLLRRMKLNIYVLQTRDLYQNWY